MSTDLNSQGSSTPSRKRSKWDEGDDVEDLSAPTQVPIPKKRAKHSKHPRLPTDRVSSSPPPQPLPPTRRNYSVYVPPRTWHPTIQSSRSVYCYERLNQIEEGSYGVVFRAKDKQTGDIVALKKLKLDEEKNGFPITALREIHSLMICRHENVVRIREVVVGDTLTQCVCSTLFLFLSCHYNHLCFFSGFNILAICLANVAMISIPFLRYTKSVRCHGFY